MADDYGDAVNPFADAVNPFAADDGGYGDAVNPFADAVNPFDDAPEEDSGITAGDFGRSIMAGGAEVGAGAGWLVNKVGELVDSQGMRVHGSAFEEMSKDSAASWNEGMSKAAQDVNKQTFLKEDEDSMLGYEWGDAGLGKVGLMLGQSLLGTAAGMGAGAGITAGLKVIPGVSRGVAAMMGYGSGEALVAAPSSGSGAEEEVRQMGQEQLSGNPEYEALIMQGDSFEDAKEKLAKAAGGDAALMTAITTAVLSSPFGMALDRIVGGEAGSFMAGLTKGAGTEAAQETLQSGAEQASINKAIQINADVDRKLMEGVPEAMVGGFFAGGAMGGGIGAFSGRAQGAATAEENAQLAAEAARNAGGDDLDAELARQGVFDEQESGVDMPTDPYTAAAWTEDVPAPMPDNPFAAQFQQMPPGPQDEMAAEEAELERALAQREVEAGRQIQGGPINIGPVTGADGFTQDNFLPYQTEEKSQALADQLEADIVQGDLELEQASFDQSAPQREPLEPVSEEDLGEPAVPARQEIEQRTVKAMNQAILDAEKDIPPPAKGNQKVANPEMELSHAVATLGGLNREEAANQGIDPAGFDKRAGGIARVFTKGGKTFDEMAEALNELGFFDDSKEGYNPNTLLEKLSRSLVGEEVFSPQAKIAPERAARQGEIVEMEQELADFENNYDEDQDAPPLGPSYQGLDDEERQLSYTVMEADLAGVDPMTVDMILDEDLSVQQINQKIQRNIANVRGRGEGRPAQPADQEGDQGDPAAPQGPSAEAESGGQETVVAENAATIAADSAESDLFGAVPVAEQSLADAVKAKDEARSGTKDVPADIDGGLFSDQQGQIDITDQPSDQPSDQALLAEFEANAAEADAREADVIASVNEPGPSIFKNGDGSVFYSVTPPANGGAKYQVTVWDKDGAVSDSKHDTPENIASYYRSEMAERGTEEEFNALTAEKPAAPGQQGNVFDLDPADNQDLIDQLKPQRDRLERAKQLFDGKDPALARIRTEKIDAILAGIDETLATGEGLNELPDTESFDRFLSKMQKDANKMRSAEDAGAEGKRIAANMAARDAELRESGDMAKPFADLESVPGVDTTAKHWDTARGAVDWSGALNLANAVRKGLNAVDVFDSTQGYRATGTDTQSMGEISGSIERLARDINGHIKQDNRMKSEDRTQRIKDMGADLGIDVGPLLSTKDLASVLPAWQQAKEGSIKPPADADVVSHIEDAIQAYVDAVGGLSKLRTSVKNHIENKQPKTAYEVGRLLRFSSASTHLGMDSFPETYYSGNALYVEPLYGNNHYKVAGKYLLDRLESMYTGTQAQKDEGDYRAKPGGETGLNGEFYEGGQFMPASARTVKGAHKFSVGKGSGPGRVLIAPGVLAAEPEGYRSIFQPNQHYISYNDDFSDVSISASAETLDHYKIDPNDLESDVAALLDGKRWQDENGEYFSTEELEEHFADQEAGAASQREADLEEAPVRQMNKRLETLDSLLGCLTG